LNPQRALDPGQWQNARPEELLSRVRGRRTGAQGTLGGAGAPTRDRSSHHAL